MYLKGKNRFPVIRLCDQRQTWGVRVGAETQDRNLETETEAETIKDPC